MLKFFRKKLIEMKQSTAASLSVIGCLDQRSKNVFNHEDTIT